LQHFRRIMFDLVDDPKYAHLDPRDKLQTDTVAEFETRNHLKGTTGGLKDFGSKDNSTNDSPQMSHTEDVGQEIIV
jgi:hypothetical protein